MRLNLFNTEILPVIVQNAETFARVGKFDAVFAADTSGIQSGNAGSRIGNTQTKHITSDLSCNTDYGLFSADVSTDGVIRAEKLVKQYGGTGGELYLTDLVAVYKTLPVVN